MPALRAARLDPVAAIFATVGDYQLEISVAPWGEGDLKVNGKKILHIDNAKNPVKRSASSPDGREITLAAEDLSRPLLAFELRLKSFDVSQPLRSNRSDHLVDRQVIAAPMLAARSDLIRPVWQRAPRIVWGQL
jgi:hypothetical protein